MAQNTDTIDYHEDYYKGMGGIYFRKILNTLIEFGELKVEKGLILDFGCGVGHLKKALNKDNIVGYDIETALSDVDDYTALQPSKIVLSGVLEHLYLDKIENLLTEFQVMNPNTSLVVYLPTENWVSKVAMRLAGIPNAHDDHVSKYKEINCLLDRYYRLGKRKYIFFRMAQVSLYTPKK